MGRSKPIAEGRPKDGPRDGPGCAPHPTPETAKRNLRATGTAYQDASARRRWMRDVYACWRNPDRKCAHPVPLDRMPGPDSLAGPGPGSTFDKARQPCRFLSVPSETEHPDMAACPWRERKGSRFRTV